jgi:hypothetical protein
VYDEERVAALRQHLGLGDDDLIEESGWDECHLTINARKVREGDPPAHWIRVAENLRRMMEAAGMDVENWQQFFLMDSDQFSRYRAIKEIFSVAGLHFEDFDLRENDLWHLVADDKYGGDEGSWHVYAIRAAFNGREVEDRRKLGYRDGGQYLVLTDEEADERARDYIESSLWAFNPGFLANMTEMPFEAFSKLAELYDNANDAILAMVENTCGLDDLVEEAIAADGRAHFLNTYDGNEDEFTYVDEDAEEEIEFYIYRMN